MFPLSMTQLREDRGAHSSFGVTLRQPPGSACGQDSLLGPHPIPGDSVRRRDTSKRPLHPGLCHAVESPLFGFSFPSRRGAFLCKSSGKCTRRRAAPGRGSEQGCTQRAVLNQIPQGPGVLQPLRGGRLHPLRIPGLFSGGRFRTRGAGDVSHPAAEPQSPPQARACRSPPVHARTPGPCASLRHPPGPPIGPDARCPRLRATPLARARNPDKGSGGGGR